jgi:hypothetical protein
LNGYILYNPYNYWVQVRSWFFIQLPGSAKNGGIKIGLCNTGIDKEGAGNESNQEFSRLRQTILSVLFL